MPYMHETTYDVQSGQFDAFQTWLRNNEDDLAGAYPEGAEYVGTFAAVFGDESRASYKTVVRIDSYAVLDRITREIEQEALLGRLMWEISAFTEGGPNSRGRAELWKRAQFRVATGD